MGFFKNLFKRKKSIQYTKAFHRSHVSLDSVLGAFRDTKSFNQSVVEALEDTLIMADVGLETTELIINEMLERQKKTPILNEEMLLDEITEIIATLLHVHQPSFDQPTVVFMVGVNGAGKTTTIGKLAHQYQQTHQVKIIAADTFRAAAIDQLKTWADRSNASFYTQTSKDPSAVIYDGLKEAKEDGSNLILIDTAGRLQSKEHLMAQLNKMRLVIDGTTGQNGLSQAKIFHESTDVNGVVITKLDGTTKGGILLAISNILHLPISYIGLGETIEDLVPFDTIEYVLQLVDAEGEMNHDN